MSWKNSRWAIKTFAMVAAAPVALAIGLLAAAPAQAQVDIRIDFQNSSPFNLGVDATPNWNVFSLRGEGSSISTSSLIDNKTGLGTGI